MIVFIQSHIFSQLKKNYFYSYGLIRRVIALPCNKKKKKSGSAYSIPSNRYLFFVFFFNRIGLNTLNQINLKMIDELYRFQKVTRNSRHSILKTFLLLRNKFSPSIKLEKSYFSPYLNIFLLYFSNSDEQLFMFFLSLFGYKID